MLEMVSSAHRVPRAEGARRRAEGAGQRTVPCGAPISSAFRRRQRSGRCGGGEGQTATSGYVLQSAAPARPSRWLQGRIVIAVHRAFVSGCEGSSIAELCSVVTRVARET